MLSGQKNISFASRGKISVEPENFAGRNWPSVMTATLCRTGSKSDNKNKSSRYNGNFNLFN
jgi:hypothetical protein